MWDDRCTLQRPIRRRRHDQVHALIVQEPKLPRVPEPQGVGRVVIRLRPLDVPQLPVRLESSVRSVSGSLSFCGRLASSSATRALVTTIGNRGSDVTRRGIGVRVRMRRV